MNPLSRREVLKLLAAASGVLVAGCGAIPERSKQRLRVVVVGGGFGGATAAKYLRLAAPEIEVVLIERKPRYITCPFSNVVLAGARDIDAITHRYDHLRDHHAIRVLHEEVSAIDAERRVVRLSQGGRIGYDRLILSPGIDMRWDGVEGYDQTASEIMPHAWQAGPQTLLLRRQLESMADGGLVVVSAPANPYRCPPGPYERASLIAEYLQRHKPRSKLLLLDSKEGFPKQPQFELGWQRRYPGMIEWVPLGQGGRVMAVEAQRGVVHTEIAEFRPAVANIIPPQQAGAIARRAGLTDQTGWCPVNQRSFESTLIPGIHVIGDSSRAGQMPKSAYAANSQAKTCAQAVLALLAGGELPEPSLINTCYSLVALDYGISVADVYRLERGEIVPVAGAGGVTPLTASEADLALEAVYAAGWYRNIIADSFD